MTDILAHGRAVLGEAGRIAWAQKVMSLVVAALIAGTCVSVLLTVGRTVAAEEAILARIDEAGTRSVIARTTGTGAIPAGVLDLLAATEQVAEVTGLSQITDSHNVLVPGGVPVPVRRAYGTLDGRPLVAATTGLPGPLGQTTARGAAALGLIDSSGGVSGAVDTGIGVRTGLRLPAHLQHIDPVILLPSSLPDRPSGEDPDAQLSQIVVIAATPQDVPAVTDLVTSLVTRSDNSVTVETSAELAAIRAAIGGQLGRFGRTTILTVLGVTVILTSCALLALINSRRKDFGRRRALGANRSLIVLLVLLQVAIPSTLGAAIGIATGMIVVHVQGHAMPGTPFTLALAVATVMASLIAAVFPAVIAARREPLNELRVP